MPYTTSYCQIKSLPSSLDENQHYRINYFPFPSPIDYIRIEHDKTHTNTAFKAFVVAGTGGNLFRPLFNAVGIGTTRCWGCIRQSEYYIWKIIPPFDERNSLVCNVNKRFIRFRASRLDTLPRVQWIYA